MTTALDLMRQDWDNRAKDDALYWVYTVHGRRYTDVSAYYREGGEQAKALVAMGLRDSGIDPQGKTLLEIGCGIGRLFPGFAESGFGEVWGVDISPEMIQRARRDCPVSDARFHLVDGVSWDGIENDTVDFCFSYNVFQHFPTSHVFWRNIEEMHRVLRPGGYFQVHFRGGYRRRQRLMLALPRPLRGPAQVLYRILTLKWLRGKSIRPDYGPAHPETWELGVAVSPDALQRVLQDKGFKDVQVRTDEGYSDGQRYWVMGRKGE